MHVPRIRGNLPMASATGLNMAQLPTGGGMGEIISTIDNLIGDNGAAIRLLEQLVNRQRPTNGQETIRIGLASSNADGGPGQILGGFSINPDGVVGRHADLNTLLESRPGGSSHSHSHGSKSEFVPLPTIQRWLDEERITQGRFAPQRTTDLLTHVVNVLLPAAREAVRKAQEAEKAGEEERQEKEKEEEGAAKAKAAAEDATKAEATLAAARDSSSANAALSSSTETDHAAPFTSTDDVSMTDGQYYPACVSAASADLLHLCFDPQLSQTPPQHRPQATPRRLLLRHRRPITAQSVRPSLL